MANSLKGYFFAAPGRVNREYAKSRRQQVFTPFHHAKNVKTVQEWRCDMETDLCVDSIHHTTQQMKCFFNWLSTNKDTSVLQKHNLKHGWFYELVSYRSAAMLQAPNVNAVHLEYSTAINKLSTYPWFQFNIKSQHCQQSYKNIPQWSKI